MHMQRIKTIGIVLLMIGASACGSGNSEGYLTDHNICKANETALDAETTTPTTFERLYGTLGSDPRAAQEFSYSVRTELWGVELYLQSNFEPTNGLTIELTNTDADGGPGGTSIATAEISSAQISSAGGWVRAQLDTLITLESITNYWLRVIPNYRSSDSNRVGWATTGGTGFATFSVENKLWSRQAGVQALYRFVECQ
jgi:hypothetical protein